MYRWWQSDRSLNTYEEMLRSFNTARWPDKGKPVNQNWRMFKKGDAIRIVCQGYGTEPLADITPDNIITFVAKKVTSLVCLNLMYHLSTDGFHL